MATPAAELHIHEGLIRALLAEQAPDLGGLPVRIVGEGWDNVIARVGEEHLARLPRRAVAAPLIAHEQRWLPLLAPRLPLAVPAPWLCGRPGAGFPWPWSLCPWLPGDTALAAPPTDLDEAARALGAFLRALHRPAPADAPRNPFRGVPLRERDTAVNERIHRLCDASRGPRVRALWTSLRDAPPWLGPPVWLHGDLHPLNLLTRGGRLSAVIDFGDLCAGDPATDLAIAWTLLPPDPRARLREAVGADDATWRRAAGWALCLSLAYLDADEHTPIPAIGRRGLAAVLDELG